MPCSMYYCLTLLKGKGTVTHNTARMNLEEAVLLETSRHRPDPTQMKYSKQTEPQTQRTGQRASIKWV